MKPWVLLPTTHGIGIDGDPPICFTKSADHLLSGDLLTTVLTRNTPALVADKCSPDLMTKPTQTLLPHWFSKPAILSCVLGTSNSTVSQNGTRLALLRRPFISWYDVRPSSLVRLLVSTDANTNQ